MKKNSMSQMILGIMCLLVMSGCKQTAPSELNFKTHHVAEIVHLTADTISPSCSVDIDLNYADDIDSVAANINAAIIETAFGMENLSPEVAVDSFVSQYTRTYVEDLLPYYTEDKNKNTDGQSWYNYYYTLTTNVDKGKAGVINYMMELNTYEGGAHGNQVITCLNFRTDNGQRLLLADCFNVGYESELTEILLAALMKKQEVSSIEELQDNGFLLWTSMYPSTNFLLTEDDVEFIYNPYEIAPYVEGLIVLKIPYSELTDLLKAE